jgi:hypothetical protein
MSSGAQPILRIPLALLALADLALLGKLLWPWSEVPSLPLSGATGIDPAVILVAYIGLILWAAGNFHGAIRKALHTSALLGLLAGLLLAVEILFKSVGEDSAQVSMLTWILFAAVALLWGIAGLRGAQATGNSGLGMISGIWSAMVSGLIAVATILTQALFAGPPPASQDPWRQYEGLAVGNPATQALVSALNSTTFYLMVGPLVAAVIALFFSLFAKRKKN